MSHQPAPAFPNPDPLLADTMPVVEVPGPRTTTVEAVPTSSSTDAVAAVVHPPTLSDPRFPPALDPELLDAIVDQVDVRSSTWAVHVEVGNVLSGPSVTSARILDRTERRRLVERVVEAADIVRANEPLARLGGVVFYPWSHPASGAVGFLCQDDSGRRTFAYLVPGEDASGEACVRLRHGPVGDGRDRLVGDASTG